RKKHIPLSKIMSVRDNFCHDKSVGWLLELPFIVEMPDLQIGSISGVDRLIIDSQLDVGEIPQTKRHVDKFTRFHGNGKSFFTVELWKFHIPDENCAKWKTARRHQSDRASASLSNRASTLLSNQLRVEGLG